jgi:outer membrane protein assembly factor BamB
MVRVLGGMALALVLAARAVAGPFAETFEMPLEGDENYFHPVALAGHLLLLGIGSEGGEARILDARDGTLRAVLTCPVVAPDEPTYCGNAVAASRQVLAVGASDHVYLFDRTGRLRRSLEARIGGRHALAVSGRRVLVGTYAAALLFDAGTGRLLRTFANPAPSPERYFGASVALVGRTAVVGAPGTGSPFVPGEPGLVYAFDLRSGVLAWTRGDPVDPAGTTHAGRYFGWQVARVGRDVLAGPRALRLDRRTGEVVVEYPDPDGGPIGPSWFGGALAASGGTVVVGDPASGDYGALHVYAAGSGTHLESVTPSLPFGGEGLGRSVALARGQMAAASDSYNANPRLVGFTR